MKYGTFQKEPCKTHQRIFTTLLLLMCLLSFFHGCAQTENSEIPAVAPSTDVTPSQDPEPTQPEEIDSEELYLTLAREKMRTMSSVDKIYQLFIVFCHALVPAILTEPLRNGRRYLSSFVYPVIHRRK